MFRDLRGLGVQGRFGFAGVRVEPARVHNVGFPA